MGNVHITKFPQNDFLKKFLDEKAMNFLMVLISHVNNGTTDHSHIGKLHKRNLHSWVKFAKLHRHVIFPIYGKSLDDHAAVSFKAYISVLATAIFRIMEN